MAGKAPKGRAALGALEKLAKRIRGALAARPRLTLCLVLLLAVVAAIKVVGWRGADPEGICLGIVGEDCPGSFARGPTGDDLVVIVHGAGGEPERMRGVVDLARGAFPGADLLVPTYRGGALSNADPRLIASVIESGIAELHRERDYRRIVLVGYSMGALLTRKALLFGHGGVWSKDRPGGRTARQDWVDRVERVVLLAGMNRGWSTSARRDEPGCRPAKRPRRFSYWLGSRLGRATGTGRLMLSMERGAPFVADLRVEWIRFARRFEGEIQAATPPVIQLLGDVDDVVSVCDNKDVEAAKDFIFIPVRQTNHRAMIDLGQNTSTRGSAEEKSPSGIQKHRADRLKLALVGQVGGGRSEDCEEAARRPECRDLERDFPSQPTGEAVDVEHVVFVLHGIRDFGEWTLDIEQQIKTQSGASRVEVVRSSYGYFPMARFLLFGARKKNVRWFMDQYTQAIARFPQAEVSYVGHSNGTYLLAAALQEYRWLDVHRVLFAGSVMPTRYPWNKFVHRPEDERQVNAFANVVSSADWVVGIFPRFFELVAELTPFEHRGYLDIGAAGFRGFTDKEFNVEFVEGGHGAAIDTADDDKIAAIASFIVHEDRGGFAAFRDAEKSNGWVDLASKLCWLVLAVLIGLVVLLGRWIVARVRKSRPQAARWAGWLYAVFIVLILYTV